MHKELCLTDKHRLSSWKFLQKKDSNKPKPKKNKTREWIDALVFALVAATIIRGLLFSAYAIPSGSMEGTELTGDQGSGPIWWTNPGYFLSVTYGKV